MKNSRNILKPIYVMHLLQEVTLRLGLRASQVASSLRKRSALQGSRCADLLGHHRSGVLTRGLLSDSHHEGLRVDGILQVSTRQRIPNERKDLKICQEPQINSGAPYRIKLA
jgi:hypothetical protein